MNFKLFKNISIFFILICIFLIFISYLYKLPLLLIFSIVSVVVSVIVTLLLSSFTVFAQDKKLDLDELKKQGFTIVECTNCEKSNVKEDIYCIFCGEKL